MQASDGGAVLLEQQVEANLPGLAENDAIGEAARGGDAFAADLKGDDGANNQAAHASQHHTFNKKPIPKRRHRRFAFPQLVTVSR
jgi:hypothetical protein